MNLDSKQCEALLAVVDAGSFEQAATRLHLTPSAVSQRVRALESQLGHPLVLRGRPCRATRVGQQYSLLGLLGGEHAGHAKGGRRLGHGPSLGRETVPTHPT